MTLEVRRAEELRRRGRQRADHARYLAGRLDRRALLRRAWGLAQDGARRFGGRVRLYLDEAMRLAWAEVRARRAVAAAMAEDRRGMEGSRFALTVPGLLVLRAAEAEAAVPGTGHGNQLELALETAHA